MDFSNIIYFKDILSRSQQFGPELVNIFVIATLYIKKAKLSIVFLIFRIIIIKKGGLKW